jgi:hypothetical protein
MSGYREIGCCGLPLPELPPNTRLLPYEQAAVQAAARAPGPVRGRLHVSDELLTRIRSRHATIDRVYGAPLYTATSR